MNTDTAPTSHRQAIDQVRSQLDTMLGQFEAVLPPQIPPRQFARVVLTAIQNRPELIECDRRSLWNACMRAAQDGLLPDGREGAMVVFKDKRLGKIAQWLPMIGGIRKKVRQSGEITTWECHCVRERDYYEYEQGDNPRIVHRPVRGNRGGIIAAYSIALFRTGERSREWMWREEIEEIRARSRTPDAGPWVTDYSEMCRKTVGRRHSKVLPMSSDVLALLNRDDYAQLPAHPAPPTAPETSRTLTDALNLLAGSQDDDRPQPADEPHDGETGELIEQVAQRDSEGETREQPQEQAQPQQQAQPEQPTELERARVMLTEADANGVLETVWNRFPVAIRRKLEPDYKNLKYRQQAAPPQAQND